MTETTQTWKEKFDEALAQHSVSGLIESLHSQATSHAGTAKTQVKTTAIKALLQHYKTSPDALFQVSCELCQSGNPTAEEVGVQLIAQCYPNHPETVVQVLHHLANNENWEVREWVAGACGNVLEANFESVYPVMQLWAQDQSENVRRAVVLAAMYAGKSRKPEFIHPILDLLEPLLSDKSRYVRDNLGPFAIGSALIHYYPNQVLPRLQKWIQSDDEQVRWNVAMIFSAAYGANYAMEARDVLEILLTDERPFVKKAVAKAMKNILKRCPGYDQGHS